MKNVIKITKKNIIKMKNELENEMGYNISTNSIGGEKKRVLSLKGEKILSNMKG